MSCVCKDDLYQIRRLSASAPCGLTLMSDCFDVARDTVSHRETTTEVSDSTDPTGTHSSSSVSSFQTVACTEHFDSSAISNMYLSTFEPSFLVTDSAAVVAITTPMTETTGLLFGFESITLLRFSIATYRTAENAMVLSSGMTVIVVSLPSVSSWSSNPGC
eukprot:ANDGO_08479.mRNA.1 hypothetical protein